MNPERCPNCGVTSSKSAKACAACGRDLSLPPSEQDEWWQEHSWQQNAAKAVVENQTQLGGQTARAGTSGTSGLFEQSLRTGVLATDVEQESHTTPWATFLLIVGQVASATSCVWSLISILIGLTVLEYMRRPGTELPAAGPLFVIGNGLLQAALAAAMFVVFTRAKGMDAAKRQQQEENLSLWEAIEALEEKTGAVSEQESQSQTGSEPS